MTGTEDGAGDGDADERTGAVDDAGVDADADAGAGAGADAGEDAADGDTFGVGIHVTEAEFQFVVHVPSDIDPGWTDPEEFQRLVERAVWDHLDREATLRGVDRRAAVGETVTLGRVTLRPDGTVVDASFREGVAES